MSKGLPRLNVPRDRSLKVHRSLPDGYVKSQSNPEDYLLAINAQGESMYYCDENCNGWIEGMPNGIPEDTMKPLRPLSGRRGESICCRRCGQEIAFNGIIS